MKSLPQDLNNKNILVTGAAGFVPSFLCEHYLELGANVFGVDNFITGSEANAELLTKNSKFKFERADIIKGLPSFANTKFDYIFHMASPASPIDFKKVPLEIMAVNSIGTQHALELSKSTGARFLEASTSEVYGDPEIHPQVESYLGNVNTVGPRSCYDESKRFSEAMAWTYHLHQNVDIRIIRIFNTYGPRMRANDGRVIPNFINQAIHNEDLTIYGDGSQTRSFCYVTDLVEAIHHVMFGDDPTPFNIGNPDEYTIKQAAELIIKSLDSSSKLKTMPLPKDDPQKRKPDIRKLKNLFGYEPKVSFEAGLKNTAEFFKQLAN
jgi:nucleoside-diphosphate-sugar epimerase